MPHNEGSVQYVLSWREPSDLQSELCHRPSGKLQAGMRSYSQTQRKIESVYSCTSNRSNNSSSSSKISGSSAIFDRSQSSPETTSALTFDSTWSSGENQEYTESYQRENDRCSERSSYPTSSHDGLRTGLGQPRVATTCEDSVHKPTPTQYPVDAADTYTACGFPDPEESNWISAEDEFKTDPAHQFWSWDGDKWFHKDKKTGSIIVCPSELD
ncbi:hypothetical protein CMUS01_02459 [Colletotrichum musicola]|uniref:Uncharacterized protein n=1 Tax=Colletotrichum musicola TaxID=2175873 RepID=A0A8H6NUU7_9PEZI|nr:hypothetical protein CMUS01_02459 [Colletotrichum musicola]